MDEKQRAVTGGVVRLIQHCQHQVPGARHDRVDDVDAGPQAKAIGDMGHDVDLDQHVSHRSNQDHGRP